MALADEGRLLSVEIERTASTHLVGNIYKGQVQNVLPGMQAAFIDIGSGKNAFLYVGDGILPQGQQKIHVGQSLPIQIIKDALGSKGPRATTHISLPGRNLVLMPMADYVGISHRIQDAAERQRLKELAEDICPPGMGLIVRTAAMEQSREALQADVVYLVRLWQSIQARHKIAAPPALLYRDADLVIRIVRDYFTAEIKELIVDDAQIYNRIISLVQYVSPDLLDRVRLYEEKTPVLRALGLEDELAKTRARQVKLRSGGFLVIDRTEALTVIDVNTGKFVGKSSLADTVYSINLEAAEEILRQLVLRDIGGIIIVDFIDMEDKAQQDELLDYMREQAKKDRTKTNIIDMTSLGLVEITRKKTRKNLANLAYTDCPYCGGTGVMKSPETICIEVIRTIRQMEQVTHIADGYTLEVSHEVAAAIKDTGCLLSLQNDIGVSIELLVKEQRRDKYMLCSNIKDK